MKRLVFTVAGLLLLSGCQYYRVREISSGKEYITNNWQMNRNNWVGTVGLTDLKTGKYVNLQQYELENITSDQAELEIGSRKD